MAGWGWGHDLLSFPLAHGLGSCLISSGGAFLSWRTSESPAELHRHPVPGIRQRLGRGALAGPFAQVLLSAPRPGRRSGRTLRMNRQLRPAAEAAPGPGPRNGLFNQLRAIRGSSAPAAPAVAGFRHGEPTPLEAVRVSPTPPEFPVILSFQPRLYFSFPSTSFRQVHRRESGAG